MIPVSQQVFPGSWAPDAPSDMFSAIGMNGQFINIVPSQKLIMVRMGEAPDTSYDVPMQFNNDIWIKLNSVICNQTGIEDNIAPVQFALRQNYPNPFNPSTIISFDLPLKSFVSLKVFDLMGREVTTIVSEEMSAGSYSKQWNAAHMSSGIYYYRLQARQVTATKKLILLR
jgi:hypothetical protein